MKTLYLGSEPYSLEEVVAEIGACYLKSYSGLPIADMSNNTAYISHWLDVLKADTRMIIKAASKGQQAVEYILINRAEVYTPSENDEMEEEMGVH